MFQDSGTAACSCRAHDHREHLELFPVRLFFSRFQLNDRAPGPVGSFRENEGLHVAFSHPLHKTLVWGR